MEQKIGPNKKGVHQGCILSPCLFNLYAEYMMRNANLRYAYDTTLTAESKEKLRSLLILLNVKEESEKVGLQLNIQKTKIMASGPITSWQIDGEIKEAMTDFILGGSKNHCRWWLQPWN